MSYGRPAVLLGAMFIALGSASATQCPTGADAAATHTVKVSPDHPKIGQKVSVTVDPAVTGAAVVCWDQDTVTITNAANTPPFEFAVPGDSKQGELTGTHTISVVAGGVVYKTTIGSPATGGDSAGTAAGSCPARAPGLDYTMAAAPLTPRIGQEMNVTIDPGITGSFTVYLDKDIVTTMNGHKTSQFEFVVPGDPKKGELKGSHTVSIVADNVTYCTEIGKPAALELDSVTSFNSVSGNSAFRVRLNGKGFDSTDKKNIRITFNDNLLEFCWSESECTLRNLTVRANLLSGQIIELTGIDPAEERSGKFRVQINDESTREVTDSEANSQYWLAIALSAVATLAMMGMVVGMLKYLRPTMIEGDGYVVRALLLDKETNTYSLSKLQFYLWTIVTVFGYVYLALAKNWFQHIFGLPAVPSGLPGIVAIAAGTAVGAQVVTNINGPKGAGQLKPSLADFVTSGDVVAAERVQFLVWTIIGALGFLLVVLRLDPRVLKELPDVPSSILSISGLSAFGYLGGKLARDPGPVISETMVSTGPDPDAVPATGDKAAGPATVQASAPNQLAGTITTAKSGLSAARQSLQSITASAFIQSAVAAASKACDAADSLVKAAEAGGITADAVANIKKLAADADAASHDAASVATSLPTNTAKADSDSAGVAASAAQRAASLAQAVAAAITPAGAPAAGSSGTFGLMEFRGRMLSRDANFRVSVGEDSSSSEVDISFDQLQPSSKDDQHLKKPRVIERDTDSTDPNMAKRLLLVINLTDNLRPLFQSGSKHIVTVINPDSQKAIFKFQLPESQKPA